MKRRIPKGAQLEYAQRLRALGIGTGPAKELQHRWISQEKRRTHKRERREGKKTIEEN